jgi:hypothetical protein
LALLAVGVLWLLLDRLPLGWGRVGGATLLAGVAAWFASAIRCLDRHQG